RGDLTPPPLRNEMPRGGGGGPRANRGRLLSRQPVGRAMEAGVSRARRLLRDRELLPAEAAPLAGGTGTFDPPLKSDAIGARLGTWPSAGVCHFACGFGRSSCWRVCAVEVGSRLRPTAPAETRCWRDASHVEAARRPSRSLVVFRGSSPVTSARRRSGPSTASASSGRSTI